MGILLENVAVLNDALQMTQNLAEPVSRLSSRTGRFPWLFPSLNLDRSHSELATPWAPVEILYASSRDRICLFRGEGGPQSATAATGSLHGKQEDCRRHACRYRGDSATVQALSRGTLSCRSGNRISFLILL
jgi:hypothetical protein